MTASSDEGRAKPAGDDDRRGGDGSTEASSGRGAAGRDSAEGGNHDQNEVADGGDRTVWTYRGYQLRAGEFNSAMVHLFRAEISRANVWRERLDATTNWAVLTTGAAISFAFGARGFGDGTEHGVIILNTLLITIFLLAEARRYRYYELWSYRVRLMETDFFAAMLVPPFHPAADWAESLAENLLHPQFPISRWEAIGRRFRRNYMWIYVLLGISWLFKVWLHPVPATGGASGLIDLAQFFENARIGPIPGELIIGVGVAFNLTVMAAGLLTIGLRESAGEVLPRYGSFGQHGGRDLWRHLDGDAGSDGGRAWFRPSRRRDQLVTFVITRHPELVGQRILEELHRGVTLIPAEGMYSGQETGVLMIALTVTEVGQLRSVVEAADPDAFVVVSPVQQVLGGGFRPLERERDDGGPAPP